MLLQDLEKFFRVGVIWESFDRSSNRTKTRLQISKLQEASNRNAHELADSNLKNTYLVSQCCEVEMRFVHVRCESERCLEESSCLQNHRQHATEKMRTNGVKLWGGAVLPFRRDPSSSRAPPDCCRPQRDRLMPTVRGGSTDTLNSGHQFPKIYSSDLDK